MQADDNVVRYLWLGVISLAGGVLGYVRKKSVSDVDKCKRDRMLSLTLEVSTSMFIAYITYEIASHFINPSGISVALAGLASFAGTDALVAGEKMLINMIKKWGDKV